MSDVNGLSLSRRTLLAGGSALGAVALSGAVPSGPSFAKAPMANTQAPYFYRFKLGNFEGTVVSDGILPLGKPDENFVGLSKPEMDKQLTDNFLPLENAVLEQNALVINTGDQLVLFDTGMGGLNMFGPTTGKLMNSLKQAGIDPKDIDAVVMSHAHIDHCGGNVADDGKPPFPERAILHYAGRLRFLDHRKQRAGRSSRCSGKRRPRTSSRFATACTSSRTARRSCRACMRSTRPAIRSGTPSS